MAVSNRFTSNAPAGEAGFGHEALEGLGDTPGALSLQEAGHVGASHENEVVPPRDLGRHRPEGISQGALHGISLYGAADLAAHGDPEPGVLVPGIGRPSREGVEDEEPVGVRLSLTIDAIEVAAA